MANQPSAADALAARFDAALAIGADASDAPVPFSQPVHMKGKARPRGGGACGSAASSASSAPTAAAPPKKVALTHSAFLMPFLNAVADAAWGGSDRAQGATYPYHHLRTRIVAGGFLWDDMCAAYAVDWRARGITLDDLQYSKKGHVPGKKQEVLLFPPAFSAHGASAIPEEVFFHLNLFVSQAANHLPLDPSPEGRAAAEVALRAFLAAAGR